MSQAVYGNPVVPDMNMPAKPARVARDTTGKPRRKERKSTFRAPGIDPKPAEVTKWINRQIHYPNLADNPEIAERAVAFVRECRRYYDDRIHLIRRDWRLIALMMKGESLADVWGMDPVHSPEIYKAREAIVARVEEAVLNYRPPFRIKGRDKLDKQTSEVLQAWMEYRLYSMKFEDSVQPLLRMMLDNKLCVAKLGWDYRVEDRVHTEAKEVKDEAKGTVEYVISRHEREEIVCNQPFLRPLDTYDFLMDPDAVDEERASFIGDVSKIEKQEALALCELGIYKNRDAIMELSAHRDTAREVNRDKMARSDTHGRGRVGEQVPHGPTPLEEVELWARFDLYGDGRPVECVINVLNEKVCTRVQENFYDRKFRPYAIARTSEDLYELFTPSALDHVIPLSIEKDQHRSLALQGHKLSVCPLGFSEKDSGDLPDSILDIHPGKFFAGAGKVEFTRVVDTLSSFFQIDALLENDVRDTFGAPKILDASSSEQGDTATEIERKIQEGNRRLKGIVRSFSRMFNRILILTHALDSQFVTKQERFRVLGKAAKALGDYALVSPMTFQHEIDFEMVGISQLGSLGLRATALANWLNMAAPFIQGDPSKYNVPLLLRDYYHLTVGTELEDDVVHAPKMLTMLMLPGEENELLRQGQQVAVEEMDPDAEHLRSHLASRAEAARRNSPQQILEVHDMHIAAHLLQMQKKELQRAASQNAAPAVQTAMQPPGAAAGSPMGGMASPASQPSAGQPPARTPRRENPGPADNNKVSSPGRSTPYSQGDNMRTSA